MKQVSRTSARVAGVLAIALLGTSLFADAPRAQTDVDLRAGYYTDMEAFAFGGGLLTPVSSGGPWFFNPNVELALEDAGNLVTINGDFHYDFASQGGSTFWLGAGPALLISNPDGGDSETDFGVNALAGIGALRGQVRPFGQLKGVLSDNSELVLQGGIRF